MGFLLTDFNWGSNLNVCIHVKVFKSYSTCPPPIIIIIGHIATVLKTFGHIKGWVVLAIAKLFKEYRKYFLTVPLQTWRVVCIGEEQNRQVPACHLCAFYEHAVTAITLLHPLPANSRRDSRVHCFWSLITIECAIFRQVGVVERPVPPHRGNVIR